MKGTRKPILEFFDLHSYSVNQPVSRFKSLFDVDMIDLYIDNNSLKRVPYYVIGDKIRQILINNMNDTTRNASSFPE